MRLVVTGGGTGGHIYPALAVAEAMKDLPAVESITYIGKTGGLESELVPQSGIAFEGIVFYGMPRGFNALLPFKLIKWAWALRQARDIAKQKLRKLKPDVVFGTGGYVSAPVLLAAKSLNIPYVLHEPDAQPGLTNRLMAKSAHVITTSFSEGAESLKHQPSQKVVVTGNPIRGSIGGLSKQQAKELLGLSFPDDKLVLLVTGGSQGARRVNQAVVEALSTLLDEFNLVVLHLCGKKLYEETINAVEAINPALKNNPSYWLQPYSTQMSALLALGDIALCRAGSLSLSEMYVCGIPTVLIPYPYAAADHQRKNAQASVRAGASLMIEDSECTAARIIAELRPLIQEPQRRQAMKAASQALGHPNATADIVRCLSELAQSK